MKNEGWKRLQGFDGEEQGNFYELGTFFLTMSQKGLGCGGEAGGRKRLLAAASSMSKALFHLVVVAGLLLQTHN